jgi:small subunit ribosomal protein S17
MQINEENKAGNESSKEKANNQKRFFMGVVASAKMDKTVVVLVERVKKHKRYGKRYMSGERFKAHDEKNLFKEGDKVKIVECRPISKEKTWRVVYGKNMN